MSYELMGPLALNYAPCYYGTSRIAFRGPTRRLDAPYVAFIGGTETYGKFIKAPFPVLVERDIGINCVNFGVANAGLDVFVNEGFVLDAARDAKATVMQVIGAHNMSNRFYTVHPRRNDRFLNASSVLTATYPEVDFAEFNFTKHMLSALFEASQERFSIVRRELQTAWVSRMKMLLRRIEGQVILLWFADHAPHATDIHDLHPVAAKDPLFVTRQMLGDLSAHVSGVVEVAASAEALAAGTSGMVFNEMEAQAAAKLLGPKAHGEAARALGEILNRIT